MRRDMDLIRELLLEIEGGKTAYDTSSTEEAAILGYTPENPMDQETADRLRYHLDLLDDAGLVDFERVDVAYYPKKLTWQGHEFVDSVRSPEVWRKTKETAKKAGGGTIELFWGIAKEIVKAEVKRHAGLDL